MSCVGSRNFLSVAASSCLAPPAGGLLTSTTRSRVEKRLTISSSGAFSDAGHSA